MSLIGQRVKKISGKEFLTGDAHYIDDLSIPDTAHLAILRSPYAHAKIVKIDTSRALLENRVIAAYTGQDMKRFIHPFSPYPHLSGGEHNEPQCYPLSVDKARFVGEPVAAVVAEDRYTAEDALELIDVEYEPLPVIVDAEQALDKATPPIYEEFVSNIGLNLTIRNGDVDAGFREADVIVKGELRMHRHSPSSIETRGYIADYDASSKSLTLWASTQQPHPLRSMLAEILGLSESKIRVIQPKIGGAFGFKTPPHYEEPLVCLLSMKLGRPIKWIETRRENLQAGHSRERVHNYEVAAKKDGTILALKVRTITNIGAFFPQQGVAQIVNAARFITGPYKIRNVSIDALGVITNKAPYFSYRGFGKEGANFLYERVMDHIADRLGIDRLAIRRTNFIQKQDFPYKSATGANYDSGDYESVLSEALAFSGYEQLKNEQRKLREDGRLVGIGVACSVEPEGGGAPPGLRSFLQTYDGCTIRITPSGKIVVLTGLADIGSGNDTGIAQIVASTLGAKLEDIQVIQGDTTICPFGIGTISGRSSVFGFSSALVTALKLKRKLVGVVAHRLEAQPEDIEANNGYFWVKGVPSSRISFGEIAELFWKDPLSLPNGIEPGLDETSYFVSENPPTVEGNGRGNTHTTYPNSVHIAMIEIEKETGRIKILRYFIVHDCGKKVNPDLVDGQVIGMAVQSLGGALFEEIVYDHDGQLLTTNFADYCIPTSLDIPEISVSDYETPSPFTPLGTKGVGEGGGIAVYSVLASAIEDCLRRLVPSIRVTNTPYTNERILRLLHESE